MKKTLLIIALATVSLFTSCREDNNDMDKILNSAACKEFLAGQSDAALYYGDGKFAVIGDDQQITYSEDRAVYMVADMEYTKSYTLDIEGALTMESKVKVYYSSVGYDKMLNESGELSMVVANVDATNNKVWIWNESKEIGFILYFEPIK